MSSVEEGEPLAVLGVGFVVIEIRGRVVCSAADPGEDTAEPQWVCRSGEGVEFCRWCSCWVGERGWSGTEGTGDVRLEDIKLSGAGRFVVVLVPASVFEFEF